MLRIVTGYHNPKRSSLLFDRTRLVVTDWAWDLARAYASAFAFAEDYA